jgi:hypothetical protein
MFRDASRSLVLTLCLLAVGSVVLWWYADALLHFARKAFPAHDPMSNILAGVLVLCLSSASAALAVSILWWPRRRRASKKGVQQ